MCLPIYLLTYLLSHSLTHSLTHLGLFAPCGAQGPCHVQMTDIEGFLTIYGHTDSLLNNNKLTTKDKCLLWLSWKLLSSLQSMAVRGIFDHSILIVFDVLKTSAEQKSRSSDNVRLKSAHVRRNIHFGRTLCQDKFFYQIISK